MFWFCMFWFYMFRPLILWVYMKVKLPTVQANTVHSEPIFERVSGRFFSMFSAGTGQEAAYKRKIMVVWVGQTLLSVTVYLQFVLIKLCNNMMCCSSGRHMRTASCSRLVSATTWPSWWLWTLRGDGQERSVVWVFDFWLWDTTVLFSVFLRKKTERSKKFFTDLMAKEHVPTMINPKPCGHLCCCAIAGCEEVMLISSSHF